MVLEKVRILMKIQYNKKTDYLEFFFKTESSYYESSSLSNGPFIIFVGEDSGDIIGYGVQEAFENIHIHEKLTPKQKLALYSWIIRKKLKLTQEEFAERLKAKYNEDGMSLRTVQRIEDCSTVAPYYYPIELKELNPEFDLNYIA